MDSATATMAQTIHFSRHLLLNKGGEGACGMPYVPCKPPPNFTGAGRHSRMRGRVPLLLKMKRATAVHKRDDSHFTFPPHYYDDEWQAKQREKTNELHRRRKAENAEEERKVEELREAASRFSGYPEKEVRNARNLVSSFIKAGEDVEEEIVEAADNGELSELVLLVIWNRLDLARRDDERHVIQALDLLYRRVEAEMLKRSSTPAMQLLNELLNLHDGSDDDEWLRECRICMLNIFPREDPFTIFAPLGMDLSKGPINSLPEEDDTLFRVDFIRETNELLQELKGQEESETIMALDPQSIAISLKLQEKKRTLKQVKALRDLAISLKW